MAETKWCPGFRFHPTDVELVLYYLKRKVLGKKFASDFIAELDIYKYAPWDLPDMSLLKTGDLEWYFFCPRGKKYASGARMNRATEIGYWKTTGKDRSVEYKNHVVGMIKTLVFHTGKAPKGDRTDWVMHEFRLEDKALTDKGVPQDSYVICKIFQKEGPGPRNGAQYGKPFDEEEWEEVGDLSVSFPIQPTICQSSVANDMHPSTIGCIGLTSVSCLSGSMPCLTPTSTPSYQVDDDISLMLDSFKEDKAISPIECSQTEATVDNPGQANNAEGGPCTDPNLIFEGLGDLDSLIGMGEDEDSFPFGQNGGYTATAHGILSSDDVPGFADPVDFLELTDLEAPLFWQSEEDGVLNQNK